MSGGLRRGDRLLRRADALTADELLAAWAVGVQLLPQAEFEALVADAVRRRQAHELSESARWN